MRLRRSPLLGEASGAEGTSAGTLGSSPRLGKTGGPSARLSPSLGSPVACPRRAEMTRHCQKPVRYTNLGETSVYAKIFVVKIPGVRKRMAGLLIL